METLYGDDRSRGFVLHCEQGRRTPTQAMQCAAHLFHEYRADCVVIEANNGGDYLPALLEQVDPTVSWRNRSRDGRQAGAGGASGAAV
ncbi:hypothetical protein [Streptomyces boninensis]|uniref:hypothetical protein n=1 Tax=Streptomyces boninensis TaxID=2039455 RepID=UPI003B216422